MTSVRYDSLPAKRIAIPGSTAASPRSRMVPVKHELSIVEKIDYDRSRQRPCFLKHAIFGPAQDGLRLVIPARISLR